MNVIIYKDDIEALRPIVNSWKEIASKNEFGIEVVNENKYLLDLCRMTMNPNADLLVLFDDIRPIGYLGLEYFDSPMGSQVIANEHYWFVLPESRGVGSMRLIKTAMQLAKLKGCSHLIMNASNLASDLHDKVCRVYEKMEFTLFETSYLCQL